MYKEFLSTCRHSEGGSESTIGYAAHGGGALAGFLVGINLLRNFKHMRWEASSYAQWGSKE
jgi:hypothetical protein